VASVATFVKFVKIESLRLGAGALFAKHPVHPAAGGGKRSRARASCACGSGLAWYGAANPSHGRGRDRLAGLSWMSSCPAAGGSGEAASRNVRCRHAAVRWNATQCVTPGKALRPSHQSGASGVSTPARP